MKYLIDVIRNIISLLIKLIINIFEVIYKLCTGPKINKTKPNIKKSIGSTVNEYTLIISRYKDAEEVNAIDYASKCERRGRYELALEFHKIGTNWYERNVVNKPSPYDTEEYKKIFRQNLKEYENKLIIYPHLSIIRNDIINKLRNYPNGIERKDLFTLVEYKGLINFGAFCNQLEKGGWVKQIKKGKNIIVMSSDKKLISNADFLKLEVFR
jgi:hypothetical protein